MRLFAAFALILSLMPSAALAQPAEKIKALPDCAALAASISELVVGPDTSIEDVEGGCHASNVAFAVSNYVHYTIEEVTLRGPDLLHAYPAGDILPAADLSIKGMRIAPQTGSPLQDYITGLMAMVMDLHLVYETDPEALTSTVSFDFKTDRLGSLFLTASLSDFDNTDMESVDRGEINGRLNQLALKLDDRGLFATVFAPMVLGLLPFDEDPRPRIGVIKADILAMLDMMPNRSLSDESRQALATYIDAFPKPEGNWSFDVISPDGLVLADFAGNWAGLADALADTVIVAVRDPAEP
ncbi:hypothetical protein [Devosia sp. XK-2]|uniref:hypothetical protein n=1 Tax=Devosia sp. XK-2 TaxID=3126689 RepID=UPI0030D019EA